MPTAFLTFALAATPVIYGLMLLGVLAFDVPRAVRRDVTLIRPLRREAEVEFGVRLRKHDVANLVASGGSLLLTPQLRVRYDSDGRQLVRSLDA